MTGRNLSQNLWHATSQETVRFPALAGDHRADLIVIGGGFTGCSAALHAAEAGAKVILVEANVIGHGASGRNVGYVNAGLWTPPDEVEALLGEREGQRLNAVLGAAPLLVSSLIDKYGISCDAEPAGSLHLAHSAGGLRDLKSRLAQHEKRGTPVRLLTAEETARRTGTPAYRGALFDPRAVIIQPFAYCRGLARAATQAGAILHELSRVLDVKRVGLGWEISTDGGRVQAPMLINATDAYHEAFTGFELPQITRARYFQVATRPLSADLLARILPGKEGTWDTATVMSSFRLDRSGRLIVGAAGSLEHAANAVHTNWAYRKMLSLFPFLKGQELDYAWFGVIGMTGDHLPKILKLGDNAYAAFGYSGRGIGPGTVFGKALARHLVAGDADALPIAPVEKYQERAIIAKQIYYETGCTMTHLVANRLS